MMMMFASIGDGLTALPSSLLSDMRQAPHDVYSSTIESDESSFFFSTILYIYAITITASIWQEHCYNPVAQ